MVAIDKERLPRHVAIIMDGNGRWATQRGLTRIAGHRRGKDSVKEVVETARRLGIPYLSLYAFSSENWQRPKDEVSALMRFLRHYLVTEMKRMMKNGSACSRSATCAVCRARSRARCATPSSAPSTTPA